MTASPDSHDPLTIARHFIDALNEGDRERFTAFLHPEAVWHSAASGEIENGRDTVSRNLFGYRGSFPDLHEEIFNAFASGGDVAIETTVTGTYGGAVVPTIPGTGRHVSLQLCYILRVQDSTITRITTYMDYRTLESQLDMFEPHLM